MAKRWARAAAYLLYVGVVVVAGLEVLLRLSYSDPEYYWDSRFLFVSPNAFENRGEGVWAYQPHARIRETAVYAVPTASVLGTRFVVEYDCQAQSNNWGLLQDTDLQPGMVATVVVGDSFTAGQGGCPWFHRLQSLRKGEILVNAGLMGTGVEQWRRLVVHLQQRGLVVERVLAIAINNDFKRPVWNWKAEELACFNAAICPTDYHPGLWLTAAHDESHARLIERSAERFSQRFSNETMIGSLQKFLRYYSFVYKFADHANETVKEFIRGRRCTNCDKIQLENERGLKGLKDLGVPLHVLMIPQRNEMGLWWQQPDSQTATAILQRHDVPYTWCPLTIADYLKNDGHPTREGYDKIVTCAHNVLDQMEATVVARH
jgi:hypothetical protein